MGDDRPVAVAEARIAEQPCWFYAVGAQQCGPVTDTELVQLCATGQVTGETLVWKQGFANWMPFAQLDANIPMAVVAGPGVELTYAQGADDPTNMFGWWWQVVRYNYVNFRGRARRKEFWSYALVNMMLMFALLIPGILMSRGTPLLSGIAIVLIALGAAVYLGTILPHLSAIVRRLHDSGKSGWFFFVGCIPYVGGLILFVLLVLDSQPGMNQYGPNPKSAIRERV